MPELINIYIFDQWWMNKILINNEKQSMKVYKFKYKKDVFIYYINKTNSLDNEFVFFVLQIVEEIWMITSLLHS